jgi:hypothetical protein
MENKKTFPVKKLLLGIAMFLIVIQIFMVDKTNPAVIEENDILTATNAPAAVGTILTNACYDCHSNKSRYPWYSNVAPVSWWMKHHINEGREELNFSEWGTYSPEKRNHKLEECLEHVEEGEMPLTSYVILHKEAALTSEEKKTLLDWFVYLKGQNK